MSTIAELLRWARPRLAHLAASELDARVLLRHVLACSDTYLIAEDRRSISAEQCSKYEELVMRRASSEPVAYLTGSREFWGLDFRVSGAVLVPRPDTELLVERSLRHLRSIEGEKRVLDLGTGSGCIAISLAKDLERSVAGVQQHATFVAVDRSLDALQIAKENAVRHSLRNIHFLQSDWFSAIRQYEAKFDLIVANPPYIAPNDPRVGKELKFEPRGALYAEGNGLADIRIILANAHRFLAPRGILMCEFGADQRERIEALSATDVGTWSFEFWRDLAGLDRAFGARHTRR